MPSKIIDARDALATETLRSHEFNRRLKKDENELPPKVAKAPLPWHERDPAPKPATTG